MPDWADKRTMAGTCQLPVACEGVIAGLTMMASAVRSRGASGHLRLMMPSILSLYGRTSRTREPTPRSAARPTSVLSSSPPSPCPCQRSVTTSPMLLASSPPLVLVSAAMPCATTAPAASVTSRTSAPVSPHSARSRPELGGATLAKNRRYRDVDDRPQTNSLMGAASSAARTWRMTAVVPATRVPLIDPALPVLLSLSSRPSLGR